MRQTSIAGSKSPGTKAAGHTIKLYIAARVFITDSRVCRVSITLMELTDDAVCVGFVESMATARI